MSKVVSSYESVVRGVSEQVPHQRHSGQHYEQVNMVSDPVRGLARRQGSVTLSESRFSTTGLAAGDAAYVRSYREFSFFVAGVEYSVMYPTTPAPVGTKVPFMFAVNKATGQRLNVNIASANAAWAAGGISAAAVAGQFLVFSGRTVAPAYTSNDIYAALVDYGVATIRVGAYSRTYTVTVKRRSDGATFTANYTTMASSYPTLLNTSDISAGAADYQKQVNDRVYAYNSAVTKWVGDAQKDIQPQNIALQLSTALHNQGFLECGSIGGVLWMNNAAEATVSDGADGDSFRMVLSEVDDPVKLSGKHWPWKVVKINPKGAEPYYMRAYPENPSSTSWQNVTWRESPREVLTPGSVFLLGVLSADGATLHLADSPAALQTASGIPVPGYSASVAGAASDEGGLPYFFGKTVTCLAMFQDRLCIIANGVIFASRTGDYFNWFRKSKLTVADDDPVEMFALGAEDDIIKAAVSYNKDLFLFGERKQYAVPGRTALTPKSATVSAAAGERDAVDMAPVVLGNLVFYGKSRPAALQVGPSKYATELSQFQLGLYQDTPESYVVSQQLSLYLRGKPSQAVPINAPNTIVLRTDGYDYGVYLYTFMDSPGSQDRTFDSWSRWEWDTNVGQVLSLTSYKNRLLVYTVRTRGTEAWLGVEQFTTDASESDRPYLDMQRSAASFAGNAGFLQKVGYRPATLAVSATADAGAVKYMGASISDYEKFISDFFPVGTPAATVGTQFPAYFSPTPPYTRDRNGVAVVNGRLVITRYIFRVAGTGGMDADLTDHNGENAKRVMSFNGRRVGLSNNLVGRQPSSDAFISVPVGRANAEHRLTVSAHTWLPMTVSAIAWNGHFFNNSRQG